MRDITDRKRNEAALVASERRLALAISANADAIWDWDIENDSAYFSPRWFEMLGYQNQQFPVDASTWARLCHPDDLGPARARIDAALRDSQSPGYAVEFRLRRADGTWAWILARGAATKRAPDGRPLAACGTNTDRTRIRETEPIGIEWKQRYDLLARAAGHLVYDCAVDRSIVLGATVAGMLGYSPEEMLDRYNQWVERVPPDDRERASRGYEQASAEGVEYNCEYRFRCKDGAYILVQDTGYPQFALVLHKRDDWRLAEDAVPAPWRGNRAAGRSRPGSGAGPYR